MSKVTNRRGPKLGWCTMRRCKAEKLRVFSQHFGSNRRQSEEQELHRFPEQRKRLRIKQ